MSAQLFGVSHGPFLLLVLPTSCSSCQLLGTERGITPAPLSPESARPEAATSCLQRGNRPSSCKHVSRTANPRRVGPDVLPTAAPSSGRKVKCSPHSSAVHVGLWGTAERKRTIRKMRRLEKRIERQLPRSNKPLHSPERDDLAPVIKPDDRADRGNRHLPYRSFPFRCSPEAKSPLSLVS